MYSSSINKCNKKLIKYYINMNLQAHSNQCVIMCYNAQFIVNRHGDYQWTHIHIHCTLSNSMTNLSMKAQMTNCFVVHSKSATYAAETYVLTGPKSHHNFRHNTNSHFKHQKTRWHNSIVYNNTNCQNGQPTHIFCPPCDISSRVILTADITTTSR